MVSADLLMNLVVNLASRQICLPTCPRPLLPSPLIALTTNALSTPRLTLRFPDPNPITGDAPRLTAAILVSLPALRATIPFYPDDVHAAVLADRRAACEKGTDVQLVVVETASGLVVGGASVRWRRPGPADSERKDDGGAWHLGYWIRSDCTGCGYATEAARCVRDAVFGQVEELAHLELWCAVDNIGSRRVAGAVGFREVGMARFSFEDKDLEGALSNDAGGVGPIGSDFHGKSIRLCFSPLELFQAALLFLAGLSLFCCLDPLQAFYRMTLEESATAT
ncbi:acyl-CoA N-acyltransferase [Zopfochytrium polystomum]|nr:acyl-CoA N-acyltransferase [Zopfochytrium polystomum]